MGYGPWVSLGLANHGNEDQLEGGQAEGSGRAAAVEAARKLYGVPSLFVVQLGGSGNCQLSTRLLL